MCTPSISARFDVRGSIGVLSEKTENVDENGLVHEKCWLCGKVTEQNAIFRGGRVEFICKECGNKIVDKP